MNQDNLHPMNRSDFPHPDWTNPEWQPLSYPAKADCPNFDLGAGLPFGMSQEEYQQAEKEALAEARRQWPTMTDYFRHVYENDLAKLPVLRKFEPRKIASPGGYASPKQAAAALFCTMSEIALKYKHDLPIAPTEITALLLNYQILQTGVPIFYVSDDFIRAVAATDLPGDFILDDLHWPMPAMVIGIPSKFSQELLGRDIGYVMAANLEEGNHPPPSWAVSLPTICCPDKIGFQFHSYGDGKLESFVTSWLKRDRVNEASTKYEYTDYTDGEHLKVEQDKDMTIKVGALLLKLLVVLNTRPGFVERGVITRPAKFNKRTGRKKQSELWSPNLIGFKFKPQRQQAGDSAHASPRWHWRRGHITHQRVGSPKSPDFVSIVSLPVIDAGPHKGDVDWLKVAPDVRAAFWRCHNRRWLEPTLINFDEP